jgi:hypothetical protein
LVHRVLSANAHTPRFSALLALLSSLLFSLSVPMQTAATVAGGASVSVALCLAAIAVASLLLQTTDVTHSRRLQVALGGLLVMALAEQHLACVVAVVVIGAKRATHHNPVARLATRSTLVGALAAAGACGVPLLRMLRPHPIVPELPSLIGSVRGGYAGVARLGWSGGQTWADSGGLLLCTALLGALWAVAKPALRAWALGGLAVLLVTNALVAQPLGPREAAVLPIRVIALGIVVLFATLAAQTLALVLLRTRLPYVGSSVIAIPALYALLVAVHADEADIRAESSLHNANDAFTQEGVWMLPQGSLLLVHSQEIALRLWAERLTHGMRPDVLVVTPQQLQYRAELNRLLELEPALAPLVRDLVLRGRASEYVLSQLADKRPLFVELDTNWDARIREHLAASGLWLEFHSQNLGRSDRYAKMITTRASVDRVIEVSKASVPPDRTTLRLVALRLKEQALVFAGLGDRAGVYPLLEQLERTGVAADFAASMKRMLDEKAHGPLDWATMQAL